MFSSLFDINPFDLDIVVDLSYIESFAVSGVICLPSHSTVLADHTFC